MVRVWLGLSLVCAACAGPRDTTRAGTPVDVAFAGAMTANQLARGASEKTAYGWNLEIIGERARYFACTEENACTFRPVEIPVKSLVAKRVVNRTHPARDDGTSGEEVDVLQLTIAGKVETTRGGVSSDARGLVVQ